MTDPVNTLLVDGTGLEVTVNKAMNRAHAKGQAQPGLYVHGFTQALASHVRWWNPKRLVVCFDAKGGSWRGAYPEYKHGRRALGVDPLLLTTLARLGVPTASAWGQEADDLLAHYARSSPGPSVVLTNDTDLYQVVGDDVVVAAARPGHDVWDSARVTEAFHVPPHRFALAKSIVGDTSDNLAGLTGYGWIRAAGLIEKVPDDHDVSLSEMVDLLELSPDEQVHVERNLALIDLSRSARFLGQQGEAPLFQSVERDGLGWDDLVDWLELHRLDKLHTALRGGLFWTKGV